MKEILSTILTFLLIGLILPVLVGGQVPPEKAPETCIMKTTIEGSGCPTAGNAATGTCCLVNAVIYITDWVFYVVLLLSILLMIIGGGMYITAAGDPAKTEKGRAILKYSIIGLIFAFLAKIFPTIVRGLIGL